uniref:Ribosomal protein S4 n=1 Tax=Mirabilis jalapa TaxID=3538 RepID=A0A7T7JNU3_MIRJA|nr:ribosomal protein S4 [Mirabilis jalapa]QQL93524.1 ribosomal protein S4 [Mirabilis jalapa]
MPALRFKTCRLLSGNVRKRELTIIQRRILRKLRKKKSYIKKKISPRKNRNSYIQLQTTRKLPLFHGNLPITKMHRGTKRTSYIPFLLNPETRLDVIPVRLHFCETIPQARQPISHRKVCVNNGIVNITHFKVSHGDIISFQENYARTRGEEIRKSFYIKKSVEKIIGKFLGHRVRRGRRRKTEWFLLLKTKKECRLLLKTKKGCRLLLKSPFLQKLRSSMQEEDLERTKKFGSEKVCLGGSFAEHNRMKRNLYHFKSLFLSKKRRNEKNRNLPTRTRSSIVYNSSLPTYSNLIYCSASSHQFSIQRRIKRIELPTHYSEVNHRTLKAVVSYGPNIDHIPHDIRLKDSNLPLRSGNGRGQNI